MAEDNESITEKAAGKAKEVAGAVTGQDDLKEAGEAQQDKAEAEREAQEKQAEAKEAEAEAQKKEAQAKDF